MTWDSAPAGGSLGRTSWSSTAKTCLLDTAQKRRSQEPGERLERDARHGTTTQINFQTLGREGTELRCNQKKTKLSKSCFGNECLSLVFPSPGVLTVWMGLCPAAPFRSEGWRWGQRLPPIFL